jgi:hypothetical protein
MMSWEICGNGCGPVGGIIPASLERMEENHKILHYRIAGLWYKT